MVAVLVPVVVVEGGRVVVVDAVAVVCPCDVVVIEGGSVVEGVVFAVEGGSVAVVVGFAVVVCTCDVVEVIVVAADVEPPTTRWQVLQDTEQLCAM